MLDRIFRPVHSSLLKNYGNDQNLILDWNRMTSFAALTVRNSALLRLWCSHLIFLILGHPASASKRKRLSKTDLKDESSMMNPIARRVMEAADGSAKMLGAHVSVAGLSSSAASFF